MEIVYTIGTLIALFSLSLRGGLNRPGNLVWDCFVLRPRNDSTNFMQLPEQLHAFSQPTLIVVTDNVQAKLFKADDHTVELIHTISTKSDDLDQDRVSIVTGAGLRSGEPEDHRKDWSRGQLYEQLNKDLMHRLQNKEFASLAFCAPQENINSLKGSLHPDLLNVANVWVPKHLIHADVSDIVAQVQEAK